jgi:hypothetical protein
MTMAKRPETSSGFAEQELDRAEAQFKAFDENVKSLTQDALNSAPLTETEEQTKLSKRELKNTGAKYIKPSRSINTKEQAKPLDEKQKQAHARAWERIECIVENKEVIGETVEFWTREFPCDPADFWQVPTNVLVNIPRLVAKNLSRCKYHRLRMEENRGTGTDGMGQYYGALVADSTIARIEVKKAISDFAF